MPAQHMTKRYAFKLSPKDRQRLDDLASYEEVRPATIIRNLIRKAHRNLPPLAQSEQTITQLRGQ